MPVSTLVTYSVERIEVMDLEGGVDAALMPNLAPARIQELFEVMVLTRRFDERMLKLQRQGRMGTFARVAGQEGAHVGASFALRDEDWMVPSFRETAAMLWRGWPIERLLPYAANARTHPDEQVAQKSSGLSGVLTNSAKRS